MFNYGSGPPRGLRREARAEDPGLLPQPKPLGNVRFFEHFEGWGSFKNLVNPYDLTHPAQRRNPYKT